MSNKGGLEMEDKLTVEEWLAIRKEAGLHIDVETAEVDWLYRGVGDPYDITPIPEGKRIFSRITGPDGKIFYVAPASSSERPELSEEEDGRTFRVTPEDEFTLPADAAVITRTNFARSPGSDIWVHFGDLPEATAAALWKKHERVLAAFPSPETMAAQAAEQVMPAFVFARRRDIEIEAGFTLAGNLIVDVTKRTRLRRRHERMLQDIVKLLVKMVAAGQMPDDAMIYGWPNGERPANADAITDNDELMTTWVRARHAIVVRVDPRKDDGTLRLDSDIARQLGLISEH
jgi:hypothetical protein